MRYFIIFKSKDLHIDWCKLNLPLEKITKSTSMEQKKQINETEKIINKLVEELALLGYNSRLKNNSRSNSKTLIQSSKNLNKVLFIRSSNDDRY